MLCQTADLNIRAFAQRAALTRIASGGRRAVPASIYYTYAAIPPSESGFWNSVKLGGYGLVELRERDQANVPTYAKQLPELQRIDLRAMPGIRNPG